MRLKNNFILIFLFFISACQMPLNEGFNSSIKPLQILEKPVYPILEEMYIPEEPVLVPMTVDMPRKKSLNEGNILQCSMVPEIERDDKTKEECKENEIVFDTNLYVGFDLNNWENLQINLIRIREYSFSLKKILEEVNRRIREIKENEKKEMDNFNKRYENLLRKNIDD